MPDTKTISTQMPGSKTARWLRFVAFWIVIVAAFGFSKQWFGGSWVIDLIVLLLVALTTTSGVRSVLGYTADLTREQITAWVAAGQPADVKAWKERTYGER
ncbi:hypothetical protein [Bosea lathyri]|uniref:Uncharacterized protein n=1 Tax=Bosea lathyri TaxID=1036778 RepID=A0A1H6BV90_9HYPH|nr:hypothetical protein [Bosea lathyri]SEG64355.1 hypothetical protein SAMN04488115_10888 [Bosea lathyri]